MSGKSTMSSSSHKELINSGIASPNSQVNLINQAILKNQLAMKAQLAPNHEDDHSKVNLLALLKQLN
jgi:hypothetical protein